MWDSTLQSGNECYSSLQAQELVPALAPNHSESNLLASPQGLNVMCQKPQKESKRIHASRVDPFLSKATEKVLSDALLGGSHAANDGWRTASYHFVMHMLTEMVATGGFEEIFDRNIERWAQSLTFMDAFVRQAFTSSQFVPPVAEFTKQNLKETMQAIEQGTQLVGSLFPFLYSLSSSPIRLDRDKDCKDKRES